MSSLTILAPFSSLVFMDIPFFPLLSNVNIGLPSIGTFDFIPSKNLLIGHPFKGSTLITSAPQSLNIAPAAGAAT